MLCRTVQQQLKHGCVINILLVTNPIYSAIGVPVKVAPHQPKPAEGIANHINIVLKNKDNLVPGFSCSAELPFLSYSTFLCVEYYKNTQLILEEDQFCLR